MYLKLYVVDLVLLVTYSKWKLNNGSFESIGNILGKAACAIIDAPYISFME